MLVDSRDVEKVVEMVGNLVVWKVEMKAERTVDRSAV
jgi:hypothetical protein